MRERDAPPPRGDIPPAWLPRLGRSGGSARLESGLAVARVVVVGSAFVLFALTPNSARRYPQFTLPMFGVAGVYIVTVLLTRSLVVRSPAYRLVTVFVDTALAMTFVVLTGGVRSPGIAILFLIAVSLAMHFRLWPALAVTVGISTLFAVVAVVLPQPDLGSPRLQSALWWALTIVLTTVLTGLLVGIAERERLLSIRAEATALAERERRKALSQVERQREQTIRVIVHEFRTPISSLRALANHLASQPAITEGDHATKEAVQLIRSHAEELTQMIEVLRGAQHRSFLPGSAPADISLPELLRVAVAGVCGDDDAVRLVVDPSCGRVRVDPVRIDHIVGNLVENALRHAASDEPIEVRARLLDGELEIVVADHGPGLPPREDGPPPPPVATGGGSGVGLWLVSQLTAAANGSLVLGTSRYGGLEARVRLPAVVVP